MQRTGQENPSTPTLGPIRDLRSRGPAGPLPLLLARPLLIKGITDEGALLRCGRHVGKTRGIRHFQIMRGQIGGIGKVGLTVWRVLLLAVAPPSHRAEVWLRAYRSHGGCR
jgi:hypothetical protein